MSPQEAIDVIKEDKPKYGQAVLCEAIDMAIKALEIQTAKKPDKTQRDNGGFPIERCPSCFSFGILKYCANCGQKIDWSEGK